MLKSLVLVTVIVIVLMVEAPNISAQQNCKTFYSPEYKFAFDYPNNQTTITNKSLSDSEFYKLIINPNINFYVKVSKSIMVPQEFLVAYAQALPDNYITIEGGVKPVIVEWTSDYRFNALNDINGAMATVTNFNHNGLCISS